MDKDIGGPSSFEFGERLSRGASPDRSRTPAEKASPEPWQEGEGTHAESRRSF
jgi:hypothetical protein